MFVFVLVHLSFLIILSNSLLINLMNHRTTEFARNLAQKTNIYALKLNPNEYMINKQLPKVPGSFFQGWLMRTTESEEKMSIIIIVGSFMSKNSRKYTQHYIYCAVDYNANDRPYIYEYFPNTDNVRISSPANASTVDIYYGIDGLGHFYCNSTHSIANFSFPQKNSVEVISWNRLPWSKEKFAFGGPEGWLGYMNLLPCRYYVHSVGSESKYKIKVSTADGTNFDSNGIGYTHIEGNLGANFPDGWVWAQAIAKNNSASFILVGGIINLGLIKTMSFILHIRRYNGNIKVFRSIDFDIPTYFLDGKRNKIEIYFRSVFKRCQARILIDSLEGKFNKVFVPTISGFSNNPGCKETYRAKTNLVLTIDGKVEENYEFSLSAMEFGGSFIDNIHISDETLKI